MNYPKSMTAARLHGPADMRIEEIPHPGEPGPGDVLLRITSVAICGSDLHSFKDARIGSSVVESPFILGHEFAAVIEAVGTNAIGGDFKPLQPGMRVAVDPAQPCWHCENCEQGNPNLCLNLKFCGNYPYHGCLSRYMQMPARCCFPMPDDMDDATGALLEPLGVAIHAHDLARIRIGNSVAILGAGTIGLSILKLVKLSGANPVFISDKFPWRLKLAEKMGGIPINCDEEDQAEAVLKATGGKGVDVAIEAAWADHSVQEAAAMARLGGRMVIVGISEDDRIELNHSVVRRKGLTIRMARRMKHTYPRAIELVKSGAVDMTDIISHRFSLEEAPQAFALNTDYKDQVVKVIIDVDKS